MIRGRDICLAGSYRPATSGVANHVVALASRFKAANRVIVVTSREAPGTGIGSDDGVQVHEVGPWLRRSGDLGRTLRKTWRMLSLRNGVELYHAHGIGNALAGLVLRSRPFVQTVHGIASVEARLRDGRPSGSHRAIRLLELAVLRRADGIICVHRELADLIVALYGVKRDRISVIPNGIDLVAFSRDQAARAAARERLGLLEEDILVTCLKTLRKDGFETVLDALALAVDRKAEIGSRRIVLLLPWRDKSIDLIGEVEQRGIAGSVIVIDPVAHREMPAFYSASDVVVIPYVKREYGLHTLAADSSVQSTLRELSEAGDACCTSLAVLEAFACESATVVGVPGAATRIQEGDIGAKVGAWDANATADAILLLAGDAGLRRRLGAAAREHVAAKFTWDRIAERVSRVYEQVLAARGS